ncbi:MAG: lysophospholipid acyltransferase family protein [Gemmatimonadota bacterium]
MSISYRFIRFLARIGILRWIRIEAEGLDHVPRTGPCILVPNHQSLLDPFLVQGVCPREVATMTKSTQFASPVIRWILGQVSAFPVRRYRVDPQTVRVLLRRLSEGKVVCVYPEGERSWDGRLQSFRRGTVRVLLRAGVPVIPVGIEGMYEVWPRWRARPRAGRTVFLRFGPPIQFGAQRGRAEREAMLPEAERLLREAILTLSGEAGRRGAHLSAEEGARIVREGVSGSAGSRGDAEL